MLLLISRFLPSVDTMIIRIFKLPDRNVLISLARMGHCDPRGQKFNPPNVDNKSG